MKFIAIVLVIIIIAVINDKDNSCTRGESLLEHHWHSGIVAVTVEKL